MRPWNTANIQEAIVDVFTRASYDPEYRLLCVSDPVAAIKEVSDIELPPNPNIRFFEDESTYEYCYKLPALVNPDAPMVEQRQTIISSLIICTLWPTGKE